VRELESASANGKLTPKTAWPRLQLLGLWTGGTLQQFLPRLKAAYGDIPCRDHGLSASEARVTIPLESNVSSGPLFVGGSFMEFIPACEVGKSEPETLFAHELPEW
jgi:hypothetical protein